MLVRSPQLIDALSLTVMSKYILFELVVTVNFVADRVETGVPEINPNFVLNIKPNGRVGEILKFENGVEQVILFTWFGTSTFLKKVRATVTASSCPALAVQAAFTHSGSRMHTRTRRLENTADCIVV